LDADLIGQREITISVVLRRGMETNGIRDVTDDAKLWVVVMTTRFPGLATPVGASGQFTSTSARAIRFSALPTT
jgi:hypothetical protein